MHKHLILYLLMSINCLLFQYLISWYSPFHYLDGHLAHPYNHLSISRSCEIQPYKQFLSHFAYCVLDISASLFSCLDTLGYSVLEIVKGISHYSAKSMLHV
ncbi:hypothetical protein ABZP36_009413 [Zizania latifolia]